jgi:hypothetical protein
LISPSQHSLISVCTDLFLGRLFMFFGKNLPFCS